MNKNQPLLNPSLKTALVSLDLNLESELTKYENQKQEVLEAANFDIDSDEPLTVDFTEFIIEDEFSLNHKENDSESNAKEEDSTSVAFTVVPTKKSLLDLLLTTWGIFAIILFFLGTAILYIYKGIEPNKAQSVSNTENQSSQLVLTEKENSRNQESPLQSTPSEDSQNNLTSATTNQNSGDTAVNPLMTNPPSPLTNSENTNTSANPVINNQPSSPYPNLTTALLSNPNNTLPPTPIASKTPISPNQTFPNNNSSSTANTIKYYVLTDYDGTESLKQIQTIIPNALITDVGIEKKIQLEVFSNETQAHQLIQTLKQRGVFAYIYIKN